MGRSGSALRSRNTRKSTCMSTSSRSRYLMATRWRGASSSMLSCGFTRVMSWSLICRHSQAQSAGLSSRWCAKPVGLRHDAPSWSLSLALVLGSMAAVISQPLPDPLRTVLVFRMMASSPSSAFTLARAAGMSVPLNVFTCMALAQCNSGHGLDSDICRYLCL
jgi:hypothetical protein